MAPERRNMFYENKKQETTEIEKPPNGDTPCWGVQIGGALLHEEIERPTSFKSAWWVEEDREDTRGLGSFISRADRLQTRIVPQSASSHLSLKMAFNGRNNEQETTERWLLVRDFDSCKQVTRATTRTAPLRMAISRNRSGTNELRTGDYGNNQRSYVPNAGLSCQKSGVIRLPERWRKETVKVGVYFVGR
ncbi:hypothetical protein AAG570_005859 [Ranatra chinensis]|uniref:Uncharacterized protein n=1 Tax=Ranatra chinensis TaxID=642074 RepID=A0ABD0XWC7_9HEMI